MIKRCSWQRDELLNKAHTLRRFHFVLRSTLRTTMQRLQPFFGFHQRRNLLKLKDVPGKINPTDDSTKLRIA